MAIEKVSEEELNNHFEYMNKAKELIKSRYQRNIKQTNNGENSQSQYIVF